MSDQMQKGGRRKVVKGQGAEKAKREQLAGAGSQGRLGKGN